MLPGVDHGDDTLGGLGSYVNMDAITASGRKCLFRFQSFHVFRRMFRKRRKEGAKARVFV